MKNVHSSKDRIKSSFFFMHECCVHKYIYLYIARQNNEIISYLILIERNIKHILY